jgi:hypothetical protein
VPVVVERSNELVKWTNEQINPVDETKETDLEFSIYS